MKHFVLYIAAVTALQLLRGSESTTRDLAKPKAELSLVSQYLKGSITRTQLVEAAEKATSTMQWQDAVTNLKHHLPKDIVSMLKHGQSKKHAKQPFEEASLDKARMTLNGMIETAQAEYDLKDMECKAFEERNRGEFDQAVADLSRIGSSIADDNVGILSSKKDINGALEMIAMQEKALKAAMGECEKTRLMNEMQLATLKNDLAVAEFIVKMTECKEGAELLQANSSASTVPQIAGCPMDDGSTQLTFKDGFLADKAGSMLSQQGQQALRVALLNSHPTLDEATKNGLKAKVKEATKQISALVTKARMSKTVVKEQQYPKECVFPFTYYGVTYTTCTNIGTKGEGTYDYGWCATAVDKAGAFVVGSGDYTKCDVWEDAAEKPSMSDIMNPPPTTAAPVPPKTEPAPEEAANKCVLGKPDCGLLTDNMALMWGDCKDAVDELTTIMAENEKQCKATEDLHNGEITTWQTALSQKNVELTEATGSLNTNTEEQSERQAEKQMLEKEYEEVWGECQAVLHEILFTQICGTKTVRGEIAKFSSVYGPTDVLDCVVTDWIPQECSIECIDQVLCEGADPLKLPAECQGGTQNMTRNIVQNKTLGAECPALSLTKGCNAIPCPINCEQSSWSPFGKCTKECGGGVESRSRNVEVRPDNGGEACGPSSDTQDCNVQSCDVDCVLHDWTVWGPCSRACGGGTQERARLINTPKEGNGLCAAEMSEERFEQQECNVMECPPEAICKAKQDVIFAVDVSGSFKQTGFDTMMEFMHELMDLYILGVNETQIGILEYSKEAKIVAPLQDNMEALLPMLDKITFQRGVTDMAQGFSLAKTILMEGRKSASSVVILLTDGKPSFQFSTKKAAQELRDSGVRVVIAPVFTYGDADFMAELASDPPEDNVLPINGLKHLAANVAEEAKTLMTSTCAELEEVVVEETEDQAMAKKMAAIFNPPKPHAHRPKRVYHRRGHNPYHP
jgi:uncharacterized protein YegL